MRRLIFTDVHANLPAMEAVLAAAGSWNEAWFLGDIIGWGPFPEECIDLLRETGARCVPGNHDRTICELKPGTLENVLWDEWTRARLNDEQIKFLQRLPSSFEQEGESSFTTCLHMQPGGGYLHPGISTGEMARAFREIRGDRVLCGHSHHLIERTSDGRYYCCVRAAGQPRDGDPRAGYAIEEYGSIVHYRVEYDMERLLRGLKKVGLEPGFLKRWSRFILTAYDPEWSRMNGC